MIDGLCEGLRLCACVLVCMNVNGCGMFHAIWLMLLLLRS